MERVLWTAKCGAAVRGGDPAKKGRCHVPARCALTPRADFFRLAACSCLPWLSFVALRGAPRGTAGMTSFRSHFCAAPVKKLLKQASGTQAKPRSVERVQKGDQETSSTSRTAQWPPSALPRPFWRLQDVFVSLRHFAVPLNLNTSPDAFDRTASKLRTANRYSESSSRAILLHVQSSSLCRPNAFFLRSIATSTYASLQKHI